ncbi:hypothetical protein [Rhizobium leguminosarum]|uniref:hypothetical protein n=1 Tax=Rhizobium leguminosarum TaxID=384 RepID=UPI001AEA5A34|nr:hypothetical protein [Rhizobium leguminosarum]MBP2443799.1 hypothetical protein [Rhizobium leguminosarum]
MERTLEGLFGEVVLVGDIWDNHEKADEARVSVLRTMLVREIDAAHDLQRLMVPMWREDQQTVLDVQEAAAAARVYVKRFEDFRSFLEGFSLEDEWFGEAVAHVDDVYADVLRISSDNIRVADGRGRKREAGIPDEFIGPTGFIPF